MPHGDYSNPQSKLTGRERQVLELAGQHLRNKEIAKRLHVSESTVKNHIRNALVKLSVGSRWRAVDAVNAANAIGASSVKQLPGYLTRRANGLYLLTYKPAVITTVGNTDKRDAYAEPGDAIGFNNICTWAAKAIWGVELEPLESRRVWLSGGVVAD